MDRREIQGSARRAFGEHGLMPDAAGSWAKLSEMGWFMMTVPEAQGGLGLGREASGAIHCELGRALVPGSAIAQMLVVEALAATGRTELLERAMAGELMTASLKSSPERGGELRSGGGAGLASSTTDQVIESGTRSLHRPAGGPPPRSGEELQTALDADRASHILLVSDARIAIAPIASAIHRQTWDETRRLFDVTPGEAETLGEGAEAKALSERLQSNLLFMLAADSIGGAEAALEMTIDYLKTRRQFDRPIAMFQALKHRVADLKITLSAAQALFWSRATGDVSLAQMGALKAHCTIAYRQIAEESIQLHGGIGLTQEHPCHLFLKRAMLNCALGGDADYWEEWAGRSLIVD